MRVLLIEENEDDVYTLRERLAGKRDDAINLECTDRWTNGLVRLESGAFDLVLLDLSVSDPEGMDRFRRCTPVPRTYLLSFFRSSRMRRWPCN